MKLFHAADIHLGRRRLDGRLPDQDLAAGFAFIAGEAIRESADAFLLAGDLFDRPQVEPPHLRQAQQVLARLKQAGIPVIAIEGNHDKGSIHSEAPTWLHYLAEDDLLVLLRTPFGPAGPALSPWDNSRKTGAWIDLCGVRFVGAGYLGSGTPHKIQQIVKCLDPDRAHVLLLHAGPEYFVGQGGGFSSADLDAIRERVCYLALGHIHKPMLHDNWACNPGSPENCDVREATVPGPRGYAVVEIDPACRTHPAALEIRDNPRRLCQRVDLDCTPFGNKLKHGGTALVDAAVDLIRARGVGPESVIDLRLTGTLNLDRIALDQRSACAEIEKAAKVLAVSLDATGLNIDTLVVPGNEVAGADVTRETLEKAAISQLLEAENLWGLEERREEISQLIHELKEAVRMGRTGEDLAERVRQSHLVGLIKNSLDEQARREPRAERDQWKATGESAAKGFEILAEVAAAQGEAPAVTGG